MKKIVGIFSILILFFLAFLKYEISQKSDIGVGYSSAQEIISLKIGDRFFAIPKNYIWSREDWKGGEATGVNIHTLLPGFDPLRDENSDIFRNPKYMRKVNILISEHSVSGSKTGRVKMTRMSIYERKLYDHGTGLKRKVEDYPARFGLTKKVFDPPSVVDEEIFFGEKKNGNIYWVSCPPENKYMTPSCKTSVEYSPKVFIKYSFPVRYLDRWEEIDDGVIELIKGFESTE